MFGWYSFEYVNIILSASRSFHYFRILHYFQIQSRTYICGRGGSGTCNCAVAAREGHDVIVIDFCPNGPKKAYFASQREPAFGTILRTDTSRRDYQVSETHYIYYIFQSAKLKAIP